MSKVTQGLKVALHASSITLGDLEHPNKMPFSGILTFFDIPSDKAVSGSGGKKVVIPSKYGIPALESIKGMAVNFDSLFMDKHVSTNKIGIIEDYEVGKPLENGGVPAYISGFVYAHDFPDEAAQIKEDQADLGFSYETIDTPVQDGVFDGQPVLVVCDDFVFSGAAILLAEKAAYTSTSLAASADDEGGENLNLDEIIAAVIAALEAKYQLQTKEALQDALNKVVDEHIEAESAIADMINNCGSDGDGDNDVSMMAGAADNKPVAKDELKAEGVEVKSEEKPAEEPEEKELKASEEVVEEEKPAEETVDFKAMADDLTAQLEATKAELEKVKADLKAEAEAKESVEHKGFAYPMTLVAKYNLDAAADSYESKITAVDARNDLNVEQKLALKMELRAEHLKTQK